MVGYVVYVLLFFFILGSMSPHHESTTTVSTPHQESAATVSTTSAQSHKTASGTGNVTVDDVASMTGVPIEDITVTGNDVVVVSPYKTNRAVRGAQQDTCDIFQKLFKDPRVQRVEVACLLSTIDVYGNSKLVEGTDYGMSAVVGHKMNWDMFYPQDLYKVCDPAYVNPALTKYELEH